MWVGGWGRPFFRLGDCDEFQNIYFGSCAWMCVCFTVETQAVGGGAVHNFKRKKCMG